MPLLAGAVLVIALFWFPMAYHLLQEREGLLAEARHDAIMSSVSAELVRVGVYGLGATGIAAVLLVMLWRELASRATRERLLAASHAALAEAEGSLRGVFDSSPDFLSVLAVDADGAITVELMNAAMAAARGVGEDYRGKRLEEVVPSPAFARASRSIARVVESGEELRTQAQVFDDERNCEVIIVPLTLDPAGGRPTRILVSIRDVSHLRRAETAVAASEARYRLLADSTTDMITHMDLTGERLFVSPASRDLLGYRSDELVGTSPLGMVHPDDAAGLAAVFAGFAAGQIERFVNINRLKHRDGRWIWIEASLRLLRDDAGRPSGVVGVMRDITERRRAEAAIAASETRFRLLAENTSELIILGGDDGTPTYVSPASFSLLGYTPTELREALHPREWVHPDDLARMSDAARGHESAGVLLRLRRKDRSWMWAEAIFRRIPGSRGQEPRIVASFRDISERQAQAEALRQAKDAAEQASRAKTEFLAAMSHEIRTPLHAVLGYADLLLEDTGIIGERRLRLERIQNAGSALRTVVDDILDFSKIEAGQVDLAAKPFRPAALIENTTSIVRGFVQTKGLDLIVDLGANVPALIVGDHDRLRQILLNLLNNAIKFTPSGAVILSVRLSGPLGPDGRAALRFAVEDTGIGVAADRLDRLFRRFSQVDGSISREFGGTGLGLAICKGLAEAMGGTIGVSSDVGRGSTFWVEATFPIAVPSAIGKADATAREPRPARILLVDDQDANRELARAVLVTAGHGVDAVADGAEAIAAVIARRYDLVLMDLQMPGMGGVEAARRIRDLPHPARSVPIIAMTADVLPADVAGIEAAGMVGHVGKPFRRDELLAAVARCLPATPAARPGDAARRHVTLDFAALDGLIATIGFATVDKILRETLDQVAEMQLASDRSEIAARARALLSPAGTLGLLDLASCLSGLERVCLSEDPVDGVLACVHAALAEARDTVAVRRQSFTRATAA